MNRVNRVIVGSSNVFRYYNQDSFKDYKDYMILKCTDIKSFEAILANLGKDDKEVIVSVLENFLDRSGSEESTDEGYLLRLGETMVEYGRIIGESARRNPATKFSIVDPIWRPKLDWYQNLYDDIIITCKETIGYIRRVNVTRVDSAPEGCQQFEKDQVHLTEAAAKIFIEAMLKNSEAFFRAPVIDLDEEDEEMDDDDDDSDLTARLGRLEGHVRARQMNDNLIFARLREEGDAAANKLKEDRVVITGITSKTVPPTDPEQRKIWIKKIAMDIFQSLIPDFGGQIHFVNQAKNKGMHIPLIEVKLDSVENAAKIRKAFSAKKRENTDLGRIFISNSVGLSTRVRVDILKAIARKISGPSYAAHVVAFISRPVMHVRSKEGSINPMVPKTFTFVDAVSAYGDKITQVELAEAYRRAGTAFKGQMEQVFVLLREKDESGRQQQWQQHQQQHRGQRSRGAGGRGQDGRKRRKEEYGDEEEYAGGSSNAYRGGRGRYSFRGSKSRR